VTGNRFWHQRSSQAIEAFASRTKQADSELPSLVLNRAQVCVVEHIREVVEIPHIAQELLSTDRTPTLAFSLPVYDKVVSQWEAERQQYLFLAPSIQVGVAKLKEYIAKTRESRIYALRSVCTVTARYLTSQTNH
jgi:hypothetical protein